MITNRPLKSDIIVGSPVKYQITTLISRVFHLHLTFITQHTIFNQCWANSSQSNSGFYLIYSTTCILGIMQFWAFLPKNTTLKPASNFLHNSLAVLVRHSQAQKSLQTDFLRNFKIFYLTEFYSD